MKRSVLIFIFFEKFHKLLSPCEYEGRQRQRQSFVRAALFVCSINDGTAIFWLARYFIMYSKLSSKLPWILNSVWERYDNRTAEKGWWTCAICISSNLRSWWKNLISVIVLQLWDRRKRMHAVLKMHKNYILVDSTISLHLSVELIFWNCINWKDMIKKPTM